LFSGRILAAEPKRGDVVVFRLPKDPSTDYIKRLIGLPGDRIQVIGGTLYVNEVAARRTYTGRYLDPEGHAERQQYEEVLPSGVKHAILLAGYETKPPPRDCPVNSFVPSGVDAENTCPFVVPSDTYFMMGDNRDNSADSRVANSGVGFVPAENLVGRAEFIFFSTNGTAAWWEIWKWPLAIRYGRLFSAIR